MFKKTLIALAALGAVAGTAAAADVTIYGRIDTSLRFSSIDHDVATMDDETSFEMASGNYTGSRVGIKGAEDLGNGLKVGFVLENGFDADDGSYDSNERLFGREAIVYLEGDFGKLAAGRMGILNGSAGSFAIGGNFNPFTTGWGDVGSQTLLWGAGFSSRYSNMLTYASPDFAGFKVYAQYSFGDNTNTDDAGVTHEEGKTTTDRYYAVGVTYNNGGLSLAGIVDSVNEQHIQGTEDSDDTLRVTLGGTYDFGVVKPYLAAAYFKDAGMSSFMDAYDTTTTGTINNLLDNNNGDWDGYAVSLGASVPAFGGTAHAMVGYMDAELQGAGEEDYQGADLTRWILGVGYEYPLSKRTLVYADAGYFKDDFDWTADNWGDRKPEGYQAAVGLVHYF